MLRQQAEQLHQQIANLYLQFPELVGDDDMLRVDTLEGATNLKELLTVVLRGIEDARALHDGTRQRLEELKTRQARFKLRIEFLRALILKILQHADVKSMELSEGTLSLRDVPPSVIVTDESLLPDVACRFRREPDKEKIKQLLAIGPVAGAVMSNGSTTISVRVK